MTQQKFSHIGMGHLVCANRVLAVINPHSACGRRYSRNAKEVGKYIDATMGKTLKSLQLIDDGSVIGATITSRTLQKRFSGTDVYKDFDEGDSIDEDSGAERQATKTI